MNSQVISAGLQHSFEENSGKIARMLWRPLNVTDYGSCVGQLKQDFDAVLESGAAGG